MNTGYGRYGATYNMVGISCFNEELSLLPKHPTEAKLKKVAVLTVACFFEYQSIGV
jgi:hypothetical protein